MRVALLTNIVSPHQLPLANEIVKLVGEDNYCYAYTEPFHQDRAKMGWGDGSAPDWCKPACECKDFLDEADLVYSELRDVELFERRLSAGKKMFYVSERWFKPVLMPFGMSLNGCFKLLHPRYFQMARQIARCFDNPGFRYLPQGPWAARDMKFLCRLFGQHYSESQIVPWGYFVGGGRGPREDGRRSVLRVLWVGRMIGWKCVDTIVRAVRSLHDRHKDVFVDLTLVGNGDKRSQIERLVNNDCRIKVIDSVPIERVRDLMRTHDVYVLSSNAEEGWGAALNEALEEGMLALGTYEAGASAAMLPGSHLFHAGDWCALSGLLLKAANGEIGPTGIGDWTAKAAAKRLLKLAE